jgi:hypothetical protein
MDGRLPVTPWTQSISLRTLRFALAASLAVSTFPLVSDAAPLPPGPGRTFVVDCGRGDRIAPKLTAARTVVIIKGTCVENLIIPVDDVVLRSDPAGGEIAASSSQIDTVLIDSARRVMITGLRITGGRNGIVATGGAMVSVVNAAVSGSQRDGIVIHGASAEITGNSVQDHPVSGVLVDGGTATITNNTIERNGDASDHNFVVGGGIVVTNAGSARIGLTQDGSAGGNVIQNNRSDGVRIDSGAGATLRSSAMLSNTRYGLVVARAHATLVGGNVIQGNGATGLFLLGAVLLQIPGHINLPIVADVISNNALSPNPGFTKDGIVAGDNSVIDLRGALVSGNFPNGIMVSNNSAARLRSSFSSVTTTITGNTANGIAVFFNSTASFQTATGNPGAPTGGPVVVTSNGRYGVCGNALGVAGGYLSIQNPATITDNAVGQINTTGC